MLSACAAMELAEVALAVEQFPALEKQAPLVPILFRPQTIQSLINVPDGEEAHKGVAGNDALMKVVREEMRSRHADFLMHAQVRGGSYCSRGRSCRP